MNVNNDRQLRRLRAAVDYSYRQMRPFREHRETAIKQYVGTFYSDNGAAKEVPVNLLAQYVNIMVRQLAARTPRVTITTKYRELMPKALDFETATNRTLKRIRFNETLRTCVMDALFSTGICKIGLYEAGSAELYGTNYQGQHPFAESIDIDDYFVDMCVSREDRITFVGDDYWVPYEAIMESDLYIKSAKQALVPSTRWEASNGEYRVDEIGGDRTSNPETYKDFVRLSDIYLPAEQLVITIPKHGDGKPIRVVEWNGPQCGPYHRLGFINIPNNVMKMGPVSLLRSLHELANSCMRKNADNAKNQKKILAAAAEAKEDADRIIEAINGDVVKIDHPESIKEFVFNGVDPQSMAFGLSVMDNFSRFAGNLDSLGGLSPQADTAKQEELLHNSASTQVQDMQAQTVEFAKNCCESIAQLLWTDPLIEIPLSRRLPGYPDLPLEENFVWTPEDRIGEFLNYNFKIEPYSLQDQTPQQKIQTILNFLNGVYMPNIQAAMQQGVVLNFEALARQFARLTDMDELEEVFEFTQPPMATRQGPIGQPPMKPPMTKRTEERINRPGATHAGKTEAMIQLAMGSKLQDSQRAALTRPVG